MYETLLLETVQSHILKVSLNRPQVMNALNTRMAEELCALFHNIGDFENPDVRAVIFTGSGHKAFCAGADLKERQGMTDEAWQRQHVIMEKTLDVLWQFPVPLIAAVNGVALGGGCEMALCCDFIIASDTARFGQPEVKRGIMPGGGSTQRLPRRIGIARAKELLYTGRLLTAAEALAWGLVNHVVSPENLLSKAVELAQMIAENAPIAVRQVKRSTDQGFDLPLPKALVLELEAYNLVVLSEDRQEGINAFNEKRGPSLSLVSPTSCSIRCFPIM